MADKTDAQRLEDAEAAANTYLNENRKLQERVENFESTRRNFRKRIKIALGYQEELEEKLRKKEEELERLDDRLTEKITLAGNLEHKAADLEGELEAVKRECKKADKRAENLAAELSARTRQRNAAEQRAKALEEQDKTDRQRATERALLVKLEDLERDNQRQRLLATLAEQALESAPDAQDHYFELAKNAGIKLKE